MFDIAVIWYGDDQRARWFKYPVKLIQYVVRIKHVLDCGHTDYYINCACRQIAQTVGSCDVEFELLRSLDRQCLAITFGVFDNHRGNVVADYAREMVHLREEERARAETVLEQSPPMRDEREDLKISTHRMLWRPKPFGGSIVKLCRKVLGSASAFSAVQ